MQPGGSAACLATSSQHTAALVTAPLPQDTVAEQAVIVMTAIIIIMEVAVKERGSSEMPKMSRGDVLRFHTESMDVNRGSFLKMAAGLCAEIRR